MESNAILLRPTEAGKHLGGIAPETLDTWRSRGRGPKYVKIGGKVFYRISDLDAFIAANVVDPRTTLV